MLNKLRVGVFKTIENQQLAKYSDNEDNKDIRYLNNEPQDKNFRYKIAIIDFLTEYSSIKLIENNMKSTLANVDKNQIWAIDQDN